MPWGGLQPASAAAKVGAPVLGSVLGGPLGSEAGNLVGSLIGQALGVPADPASISSVLATDPNAVAKIQALEAAHAATLQAAASDMNSARQQTMELAKAGSKIAWGAPVVSTVVTMGFISVAFWCVLHGVTESPVTSMLLGALATKFGTTVDYWLGSSFQNSSTPATKK
jgi:hypothetical protein